MMIPPILSIPSEPPTTEKELLCRANALAGLNLYQLTTYANLVMPDNLKQDKGWIGVLLEYYLGAGSGNRSEQDFSNIGIELKTIPVDKSGRPLETTFVCMASFTDNIGIVWETSYIRYKLSRVLWIPVEGHREIPLAQRRIGTPLLWSPSFEEETQLQKDWEELMDFITLGKVENITSHHGSVLQLRPKAANSRILTPAIGKFGQPIFTLPRGFYLRKMFTSKVLARYFS